MKPFKFKQFTVRQDKAAMKIGTDAVLLGAWCSLDNNPESILDVGAGTGVVALMLAQRSDAMTVDAVEIEENAYEQCVENFELSDWGDRLYCYHSSFQEFAKEIEEEEECYDLIVSNPPFYKNAFETSNVSRNKARHAVFLSFEDLLKGVVTVLSSEGKFVTIIPFIYVEEFEELAKEQSLYINRTCEVQGNKSSKITRVLLELSFNKIPLEKERLIIEKERHVYTESYVRMTKDFYLKF